MVGRYISKIPPVLDYNEKLKEISEVKRAKSPNNSPLQRKVFQKDQATNQPVIIKHTPATTQPPKRVVQTQMQQRQKANLPSLDLMARNQHNYYQPKLFFDELN